MRNATDRGDAPDLGVGPSDGTTVKRRGRRAQASSPDGSDRAFRRQHRWCLAGQDVVIVAERLAKLAMRVDPGHREDVALAMRLFSEALEECERAIDAYELEAMGRPGLPPGPVDG